MTQAKPKASQAMGFHGALGREKPFQVLIEWTLGGCQSGVAGSPGRSDRDCGCELGPSQGTQQDGGLKRDQVRLEECEPLDLLGPNPPLNLPLASINLFPPFKILIYFT